MNNLDICLRSSARELTPDDVRSMFSFRNFFDRDWNPGGLCQNNFVDNGNGTITDNATGIMWHQRGSGEEVSSQDVEGQIYWLNRTRYAGFSDWRLPTLEEGMSLVENKPHPKTGRYLNPLFEEIFWVWTAGIVGGEGLAQILPGTRYWLAAQSEMQPTVTMANEHFQPTAPVAPILARSAEVGR